MNKPYTHTLDGFGDERDGTPVRILERLGETAIVDGADYRGNVSLARLKPIASAKPINQQTPGPMVTHDLGLPVGVIQVHTANRQTVVATVHYHAGSDNTPEDAKPNAALLAASYTLLDRAARKLGVDAVELAESIDLAALIRTLTACADALDIAFEAEGDTFGVHHNDAGDAAIEACALLSKLPAKR